MLWGNKQRYKYVAITVLKLSGKNLPKTYLYLLYLLYLREKETDVYRFGDGELDMVQDRLAYLPSTVLFLCATNVWVSELSVRLGGWE